MWSTSIAARFRRRSLLDVMLLMSFFPHLVAGPDRAGADLLPQFAAGPSSTGGMARSAPCC